MEKRYQEFLDFAAKYKTIYSLGGSYQKGEVEVLLDVDRYPEAEKKAAQRCLDTKITDDPQKAREYTKIGITENAWGIFLNEPVKFPPTGDIGVFSYFIHWGVLNVGRAGVAVLPRVTANHFAFIHIFRTPTKQWSMEIPRGKSEPLLSMISLLKSELSSEADAKVVGKPKRLGSIFPDNGLMKGSVAIYKADIEISNQNFVSEEDYEAISGVTILSTKKIDQAIKDGYYLDKKTNRKYHFDDGFTLSAISLAKANNEFR
jgi:hypothetical protein